MTTENEHNCIDKDDLLNSTKSNIEKFGLQVIMVNSTSYFPSFAYSIGLTESYNYPEIICFGLSNDLGHAIVNDIAELIKNGEKFEAGKISDEIFKDSRAAFINVDIRNIEDYFGAALNYFGDKSFDALQVVWTDRMTIFLGKIILKKNFYISNRFLTETLNLSFTNPKT